MSAGNTAWVLVSSALVLFMTPGLAFYYAGMVRAKNVLSMLMQNYFVMGIVSIVWALVGFSLAFGKDAGFGLIGNFGFAGLLHLGLKGHIPGYSGSSALSIPPLAFMIFQMMFAIITAGLITGATADRLKFSSFAIFITLWSLLVYSPVAHWVFSPNGWLFKLGALDFAGGTVVHINSGMAGLAVAIVIGKRKGWPKEPMPPHSLPLTLLGAGMLWFGWFGFNAGSALGANELAAQAFVNTQLATAGGLLAWLLVEKFKDGHPTTLGAASGAVAGLVAITPACGYVNPLSSIVIGILAGAVCSVAVRIKFRFGFDDALDVVGVHVVGGIIGALSLGFLATTSINSAGSNGLFFGGGISLLGVQTLAVVSVMVFSFVASFILAKVIDKTFGLRVSRVDEEEGLDMTQHSEAAYSLSGTGRFGQ